MRGKNEGSVYKAANGLWTASVELPTVNGVRRRKVIRHKDKTTVLTRMDSLKTELRKNGDLPTASQTVTQWFTYWLKIQQREIRPKTWANYRSIVNNHIIPTIGKTRLDKLTPEHVRRVHDTMRTKGLSSTTALAAHAILSSAFTAAEREGRMSRNPAKLTNPPRREVVHLDVLTTEEASRIVHSDQKARNAILWATFLLTGARRGEILGLTWDRVTDVLDLSWQLQRHTADMIAPADYEYQRLHKSLYLTRPKSRAGWRIVPLVEPLKTYLDQWRSIQEPNDYGLVFATTTGTPIDPDNASHLWRDTLTTLGLNKRVRLHDLRHTTVDLLYEAGVPEQIITEIIGHSSRSMTRAYKSRGNRPQLTDAMNRMSALLDPQASTSENLALPAP